MSEEEQHDDDPSVIADGATWGREADGLTPTQRNTLNRLAAAPHERPAFPPELAAELRGDLADRLGPIAERLSDTLFLNKWKLHQALGCEARPDDDFEWTAPKARGTVGHKAIELSIMRRDEPTPLELIDDAIASLISEQRSLGDWLGQQDESTVARVRAEANNALVAFLECWPQIDRKWWPVVEGTMTVDFDKVRLSGRPDLTVGRAKGNVAGKVIVDLKTGRPHPAHRADLHFYALLDTIRIGTPPRLLASSYLDSGSLVCEEVTEDLLLATVERVVDVAGRIATLEAGERDPVKIPSMQCKWCALRETCDEGVAFLRTSRDDGTIDDGY